MAKLNFDDGAVWDNTLTTDKYSTKVAGHMGRGKANVYVMGGRIRGLDTNGKPLVLVTGTYDLDSSYPTGGEDISELWNMFPTAYVGSLFEQPNVAAVRTVSVDAGNKKLIGYTDAFTTQVANATNLSAITGKRFIAWGY